MQENKKKCLIMPYSSYSEDAKRFVEKALNNAGGHTPPAMRAPVSYTYILFNIFKPELDEEKTIDAYTLSKKAKAERYIRKYDECRQIAYSYRILAGEPVILKPKYTLSDVIWAAVNSVKKSEYAPYDDNTIYTHDSELNETVRWSEFCSRHLCCNGYRANGNAEIMTVAGLGEKLKEASIRTVAEVVKAGDALAKKERAETKEQRKAEKAARDAKYEKWSHADLWEVKKLNRLYCPMPDKGIYADETRPPMDYDISELKAAYKAEKQNYFDLDPDLGVWPHKYDRHSTPVRKAIAEGYICVRSPYHGTAYGARGEGTWIRETDLPKWFSQRKSQYKKKLDGVIEEYERLDAEFAQVREEAYEEMAADWDRELPSRLYIQAHYLSDDTRAYLERAAKRRDEDRRDDELHYFWDAFLEGYEDYVDDAFDIDADTWIYSDDMTDDEENNMTAKAFRAAHEEKEMDEDEEEMLNREQEAYDLDDDFLNSSIDRYDDDGSMFGTDYDYDDYSDD